MDFLANIQRLQQSNVSVPSSSSSSSSSAVPSLLVTNRNPLPSSTVETNPSSLPTTASPSANLFNLLNPSTLTPTKPLLSPASSSASNSAAVLSMLSSSTASTTTTTSSLSHISPLKSSLTVSKGMTLLNQYRPRSGTDQLGEGRLCIYDINQDKDKDITPQTSRITAFDTKPSRARNGKLVCTGQYFKAYNVKEMVRIIPHTDANIRSTVSHSGQDITDIACANLPFFSSSTTSVVRSASSSIPQDVFATADNAGNIYVTVVALTSGPERQARVTVANISTPTSPEDVTTVSSFLPTYVRWHPTLPAHLFVNRGRNIWLIDLNAYGVPASVFGEDDSADNGLKDSGSSSNGLGLGLGTINGPTWINATPKNITLSFSNVLVSVPFTINDWDVCSREAPLVSTNGNASDQVGWDSGDYLLSVLDSSQASVQVYLGSNARETASVWMTIPFGTMGPSTYTYQSLRLVRSEIVLPSTGNRYSVYGIVLLSNTLPGLLLHTLPTDPMTRTLALPSTENYENYKVTQSWYNHFLRIENGFDSATGSIDLHLACLNLSSSIGSLVTIADRSGSQLITIQIIPPVSLDTTDRWDNRWKYAHVLHKDSTVPIYSMHLTLPYIEARMQELENSNAPSITNNTSSNVSLAELYDQMELFVIQLGSVNVLRLPYHDLVINSSDINGNSGSNDSTNVGAVTVPPVVTKPMVPSPSPAPTTVTIPTLLTPVRITASSVPTLVPTVTSSVPLLVPTAPVSTTTTTTTPTPTATISTDTRPSVTKESSLPSKPSIDAEGSAVSLSSQAIVDSTTSTLQEIRSLATSIHKDATERESKLHTEFTSLLQAISGSLRTEIPLSLKSVVTEAVNEQTQLMGEVLDASYGNLSTHVNTSLSPVITTTIENAMKTQSANMQATLKSLPKTLSTEIVTNLKPMATEAFKTAFTEVLVPSFERGIANMVSQITTRLDTNVTLLTEKLQSSIDTNTNNINQLTNAVSTLQQVSAQLPTINVLIDNQKGLVHDTRNTLSTLTQITSSVDTQRLTMNNEVSGLRNDIRTLHEQMNALQSYLRSLPNNISLSNTVVPSSNVHPTQPHTGFPPGVVPPPHAPPHSAPLLSPPQHVNQPMYTQPQYYYGPPVNAAQSGYPSQPQQPPQQSFPPPVPTPVVTSVPAPTTTTISVPPTNVSPSSSTQPPVASPLHALMNAANNARSNTTGGPVVNLHSLLGNAAPTPATATTTSTTTTNTPSTASAALLSALNSSSSTASSVPSTTSETIIPSVFPSNPYYQGTTLPKPLPQPIPMDDKEKLINSKLITGNVTEALQEAINVSTSGPVAYMVKWLSANPSNKQHYRNMENYLKSIGPFFRLCLLQRLGILINKDTCGSTVNDNEIIVRIDWLLMVYKVMKDVEDSSKDSEVAAHWKNVVEQLGTDITSCSTNRSNNSSITARCTYFLNLSK